MAEQQQQHKPGGYYSGESNIRTADVDLVLHSIYID